MSTILPFQLFLRSLDAEGISVRVRDYQRIALALQGEGRWTRQRLRDTLVVLLAKNENQEQVLLRRFNQFFDFSLGVKESEDEIDVRACLADLQILGGAPNKLQKNNLILFLLMNQNHLDFIIVVFV